MLGGLTRQGRLKARGGSGWRTLALGLLGVYMCLAACANAAVMGLDYGTDWFTIALANPGRPLDLVLNRDANRQTASVVTVNGLERTFGSNAIAIAPRMPEVTFMAVRNLLGVTYDSEAATLFRKQFPNKMVRTAEDTVAFEVANATLTVPEIVAMQLQHAKQLVAESEGVEVRDAVLTVPSFFDRAQRQAMLDAAELAGLRTAALVNDGSAVALSYAMNCAFEAPERHVFYDMGASKTVATVSGFYARKGAVKTKAKAKAKKPLVISTHAFAADSTLGGQEVDFIMRDLLAAKFAASGGDAVDLAGSARAMTRLLREAKRVKTILSVNAEATASVEGLINGIDFRTPITRVELERATAHLLPRIRAPIDIALAEANLTIADIDSIVLVGGGSRVPFVQRALSDAFGADKLSRTLESLVYHLRDIAEDDDVVAVTTPAQRDALDAALTAASEWLEDNAEHAQTAAIEAQIATLRTLEAPITFRKAQHAARPDRIDTLRTTIAQAENFTALIRAQYSSAEIDSAAEVLEALEDSLDSTLSWLDAMVIKQDALAPSDDPVLTVEDIDAKAQAIERGLAKLIAENIKKAQESAAAEPSVDEHADSVKDDESASSPAEPEPSYTESDSDPRDAGHDEL
ncbi:lumenal Hsp70 protein [Coemansia sp. RSA 1853]|nr:lumenal Hsp70 protein [Coemansia sp. RSA 1853]